MHTRYEPSRELRRLAMQQDGVLTRQQALKLGVPRASLSRLVRQEQWQSLLPGTFLTHDQPAAWTSLAWSGVLTGGEGARLGGYAAAHLHGLVDAAPEIVTILIPHQRQRRSQDQWNFVRERAGVRVPRNVGSPPRTPIDDTVLDLSADLFHDGPVRTPAHWVTRAVQLRLTTADRLRQALSNRLWLPGRDELAALLIDVDAGTESPLEIRYVRDVERAHGLPTGTRQVRVVQGGTAWRRDVRYEKYGVLVELDGVTGHSGTDRFRDFRRDNAALLSGEVTLRYGWDDTTRRSCAVAMQVGEMLMRGGWQGQPTRCDRCLAA